MYVYVLDVVYVMESMGLAYAITNSNSNTTGFKNNKVPEIEESQRFTHTYIHIHTYIHTYIPLHTYTYIQTYIHTYSILTLDPAIDELLTFG